MQKMIYISLSLRYQRQLTLIAPDVVKGFFREAARVAADCGGKALPSPSGAAYAFSGEDLCPSFSAFLLVKSILDLAKEREERIREYLLFVDASDEDVPQADIAEREASCDNVILPDRAAVITAEAAPLLVPYTRLKKIEGTSLFLLAGKEKGGAAFKERISFLERPSLLPFAGARKDGQDSLLFALLNTASLLNEAFDVPSFLTKKEKDEFTECKKTARRLSSMRFDPEHPVYIAQGSLAYVKLFFTALSRLYAERYSREVVEIDVTEGSFCQERLKRAENFLSEICAFKRQMKDAAQKERKVEGASVPPDIMDAAYLLFRSSAFLYAGEASSLLRFLGKGLIFRKALDEWLSGAGFPHGAGFIRRARTLSLCGFPPEERRKKLDKFLFAYLEDRCKAGEIYPSLDFCAGLEGLGVKAPDAFFVTAAYRRPSPEEAAEKLKTSFPGAASAIAELADAEKKLARADFRAAQAGANQALQVFQSAKIISGEFEAFSLLARISFLQNLSPAGDAFSYLDYAFDCTARMHDLEAQMRALFDIASMRFLSGSLVQARQAAIQLAEKAAGCYDKTWAAAARFLEARIFFETGDYRASESAFLAIEQKCQKLKDGKLSALCSAWALRSRIYQGKRASDASWQEGLYEDVPEAALFALEGAALSALEGRTAEGESLFFSLPEKIENVAPESFHSPPYEWSWASSFAFAEDRYLACGPLGAAGALYSALYAFCLALYKKDKGLLASARDSISELAKSLLPAARPRAYVLYCLCLELESRISARNSPAAISFLSRAFNGAQFLANNITDTAMREKFLAEPYWNARLYAAARENKLI